MKEFFYGAKCEFGNESYYQYNSGIEMKKKLNKSATEFLSWIGDRHEDLIHAFGNPETYYSSALLDKAERKFWGRIITSGTHPKRIGFWRFIRRKCGIWN